MLKCMRVPILLLAAALALVLVSMPMHAEGPVPAPIAQAYQLWSAGHPKEAIAILEPMLRNDAQNFTENERGAAWDLLGSSYQDAEMFDQARQAYGKAMEMLRSIPTAQAQYAATIDNLATLEEAQGQTDAAKALAQKASRIYDVIGDPAGIAIASIDLAAIAYGQKDYRTARRNLATAFKEGGATTRLKEDDVAAMYTVMSALAFHDGKAEEAISSIQQAIDRWTRAHGPGYFMLSTGYILRGQAFAKTGDYVRATADAQHALAVAEAAIGRNTLSYLTAETIYAQILRASGAKQQASRMQKEASNAMANLQLRQCRGCTIDASGLR